MQMVDAYGVESSTAPASSRSNPAVAARAASFVRTLSALVVTAAAALSLLEVVVGADPLRVVDDAFWMVGVPTGPSVVVGMALLVLGAALRAGKRAGWWVLAVLLGLSAVAAFAEGGSGVEQVVVPLVWIAALVAGRSAFGAQVASGSWASALLTATIGLGTALAAGWALAGATPGSPHLPWLRLVWVVDQLTGGTFELAGPNAVTGWLPVVLDLTGGCVLGAALALFFRGVRVRRAAHAEDELRLRTLIAAHGSDDSLAWFATRRDKRVVFGAGGRAAVAHRVVGGSSVAAGDPIGPVDDWPSAVAAWLVEARRYGWQPVVLAASEVGAAVYREHGLRVRRIGDEAVVDLARLLRTGGRSGRVRRAVRRLSADGYRTTVRRIRDVPGPDLAAIAERADRWRHGSVERGFSMASGRTADPADLDNLIVEAFAPDGSPCGLLTFAPWGGDGASLDVMRRSADAPAGIVEFMIGHLAAGGGIRRVSLNFVLFREALESGSRLGAGPVERAWHTVLRVTSAFVQIESLHTFSCTFEPDWAPRLLCWSGSSARAVVAAGLAEGFLHVPGYGGGDRATAARPRDQVFLHQVHLLDPTAPDEVRASYPGLVGLVDDIAALRRRHAGLGRDEHSGVTATVAGRIRARRAFGALAFATVRAGAQQIQVIVEASTAGTDALSAWKATVGPDDLVVVTGEIVASRSGELSVLADRWTLAATSVRPVHADPLCDAAEQTLLRLGFTEAALPPWHPAQTGGFGPGSDGTAERLFHIDRSPGGPVLHVRQSLADAPAMRELLDHLVTDLPAAGAHAAPGAVESRLPAALVPFARPRDDDPDTADAWRLVADGREVAVGATGLTDPARLRGMLGSGAVIGVFERGVLPFATLRVDLVALAGTAVPLAVRLTTSAAP
ncbi:phosphatidylglycerol lysyltransferase domain-containing protein [Pseudonocardia sp. TRM90224]|uniref:phosphatidylglycerol lysyltransferase domain-containing protein n=1 Tax=Pseudonocardia sp. TRM90224 TaxID=2812678 RepID=UPI001E41C1D0|nr:phosphatidylglycerol lysyltransferase domain-containing protein [Pseudonocardia sp. TRM90224]